MVRCQLPYEGEATLAQCPHDNTRPTGAIGDGLVIQIAAVVTNKLSRQETPNSVGRQKDTAL